MRNGEYASHGNSSFFSKASQQGKPIEIDGKGRVDSQSLINNCAETNKTTCGDSWEEN